MSDEFRGRLEGMGSAPLPGTTAGGLTGVAKVRRILLDAEAADIETGGHGRGGDVRVKDADGVVRIRLDSGGSEGVFGGAPESATATVRIHGGDGAVSVGGATTNGKVSVRTAEGSVTATLKASEGDTAGLWLGDGGRDGLVVLSDRDGTHRASLGAADRGQLRLHSQDGNLTVNVSAQEGRSDAGLWAGGSGSDGWVVLRGSEGARRATLSAERHGQLNLYDEAGKLTARVIAQEDRTMAGLWAGGSGHDGWVVLRDGAEATRIALDGHEGEVRVHRSSGDLAIRLRGEGASGWFGGRGQAGDILIFAANVAEPTPDNASIWLQGHTGDIVLRNADCAEEFEVRTEEGVGPGSVLVLDSDGRLVLCREPYDSRAAGVVSGAAGVRPGIVLGRVPGASDRLPVALVGKVVCNVDADFGALRVGSLLTTSPRPGFAMLASDRDRAFGAVIGKAMAPMDAGTGAIPILVGLQ